MQTFHLLNRGVEKRKVFLNEKDYLRFVHDLYDFNDIRNTTQSYYHRRKNKSPKLITKSTITDIRRPLKYKKEPLVDILCWCLMPNHPHILATEKLDGNISLFSKKMFGGYTKYFNEKNERSGVLFQGKSKMILIEDNSHFMYLSFYIHTNPLNLFQPGWKEMGLKNKKGAIDFLKNYKWSSYCDIIGKGNFSEIINKDLFFDFFSTNEKKYQKDLEDWLGDKCFITDVRRP